MQQGDSPELGTGPLVLDTRLCSDCATFAGHVLPTAGAKNEGAVLSVISGHLPSEGGPPQM